MTPGRVVEGATQSGVRGLYKWDCFSDRDRLGLLTGLRGQVNPNLLAHPYRDVLTFYCLEPFGFDADLIHTGS
jgi:hypothetical protein